MAIYNTAVEAFQAKRYAEARRFWARANELGDGDAASNLGFLLYHGWGGPADSVAAARLWQVAMGRRAAEAHRHVAQAIQDGDSRFGTAVDAYSHAVAAARLAREPQEVGGDGVAQDAERLLQELQPRLTAAELAAAERQGQAWVRAYPAH